MARSLTVRPTKYRVIIEDDGCARRLDREEAVPEGATVFYLKPMPLDKAMEISKRSRKEDLEAVVVETAKTTIVGWEGLRDEESGEAVSYDELLISGLPFDVVMELMNVIKPDRKEREGK